MNRLQELGAEGQAIWLDYIRRGLFSSGEFEAFLRDDGISGVTSNPSIFEKAIAGSADYDEGLRRLIEADPHRPVKELYEALAIEDIQRAADLLRARYDATHGTDGFVSLEVSPLLAHDTPATIAEARRLWGSVARPNLMIKVPATTEGVPAIESLLAEGINVNVTLMFSARDYEAIAHAYLRGIARTKEPEKVASIASFFVSRVDSYVDRALKTLGTPEATALQGQAAIANSRLAYARFQEIFGGAEFAQLRDRGAHPQKVLWASTSVKDPRYRDTMYAEELIGPETVDTMPPVLIQAYRDHGTTRGPTVTVEVEKAREVVARLAKLGIDLDEVGVALQVDGLKAFADAFRQLFEAIETKRSKLLSGVIDPEREQLGAYGASVTARLQAWEAASAGRRIWRKDPTFWPRADPKSVETRLGWLSLPEGMHGESAEFEEFAREIRDAGFVHIALLGMGGSSLAAQVYASTFGRRAGFPELRGLDSTHPDAVRAFLGALDLPHTLFVVSSKSGTTLEPNSFFRFFHEQVRGTRPDPGAQFIAITDPGTPLEALAHQQGFRRCFLATPDVGGRYSALTAFGLVPAALIGVDIGGVLDRAWRMAEGCASVVAVSANPGLELGATLGELGRAGRDKVTIVTSPGLAEFPAWAEQLIAESTGKSGTGIVPIAGEVRPFDPALGHDRVAVLLRLASEPVPVLEAALRALADAGEPTIHIELSDPLDIGQEFFRWEMGVASAGAVLGIDPFDQPDVEIAKELARRAMGSSAGSASTEAPVPSSVSSVHALGEALRRWMGFAGPGDYVAIQAYLAPTVATQKGLDAVRAALRAKLGLSTTLGFGPRFLHSTGQLHKGGPATGLFFQLIDHPSADLAVPESGSTFGRIIRAQAVGDAAALRAKGRRVLTVDLERDASAGLALVRQVIDG
ncbi:MAG: bifunctional transaldolase/phosoglucose isomerase [Thermoplasmata archaeon]